MKETLKIMIRQNSAGMPKIQFLEIIYLGIFDPEIPQHHFRGDIKCYGKIFTLLLEVRNGGITGIINTMLTMSAIFAHYINFSIDFFPVEW